MVLILTNILHIFILAMMGGFVILIISAAMGNLDVWTRRYTRDVRGNRIHPNRIKRAK